MKRYEKTGLCVMVVVVVVMVHTILYISVIDIENIFVFLCFCIINITCLNMQLSFICFIVTG